MSTATLSPFLQPASSIVLRHQKAGLPVADSRNLMLAIAPAGVHPTGPSSSWVHVPTPSLGSDPLVEIWESSGTVSRRSENGIVAATAGELVLGAAVAEAGEGLVEATNRVYVRIIDLLRSEGMPHLVRMWNYFPDINRIETTERYQQFCVARFEAFEAAGLDMSKDLPAASAVGSKTGALTVVFLASSRRPRYVENPRQVSAFRYPEKYGPRSPSFSRGALLADQRTLLTSGTASIVGHQTLHEGNLTAQVDETLRNLDAVIAEAFGDGNNLDSPDLETLLKVYVRRASDQAAVAARLERIVPARSISWIHADICRADLLVEIEAFVRRV